MKISENKTPGKKQIAGSFSQEFYMGRRELAAFLRKLADEIEGSNELTISTDEWELPFTFSDQIEVEIELDQDELEIELEFDKCKGSGLSVASPFLIFSLFSSDLLLFYFLISPFFLQRLPNLRSSNTLRYTQAAARTCSHPSRVGPANSRTSLM